MVEIEQDVNKITMEIISPKSMTIYTPYDENQRTNDPLQSQIGPITRARAQKLQEAFNGLMKEFIWANPDENVGWKTKHKGYVSNVN